FEARRKIAAWRKEYNEQRPHSSLGYRTPREFATWMGTAADGEKLPSSAAKTETQETMKVV
ncbi:MAG TPA: integrase core domain-containing protein, partial [Terriglobales bacterium]|nr:integrase core domain-containing protein [Terriglobales bacterium]